MIFVPAPLSATSYGPEALSLFTAMTVQPSDARKELIDKTIQDLKDASLWNKFDVLYFFAAHHSQAGCVNWRNPSFAEITPRNSPAFTVDTGFQGNASNAWLDTNATYTSFTQYTLNQAHAGLWVTTSTAHNGYDMGSVSNASTFMITRASSGGGLNFFINTDENNAPAVPSAAGHSLINRSSGSANQVYRDAAALSAINRPVTVLPLGNASFLRGSTVYSNKGLAIGHIGGHLTAGEVSDLYNILSYYMGNL